MFRVLGVYNFGSPLNNITLHLNDNVFFFREFWGHDESQQYESDSSEPEIRKLFNSDIANDGRDSIMTDGSSKNKPLTPTFLIEMRKRQQERAERREEIRKIHDARADEKRRKAFEAETLRQGH